jgi:flagellar biosynthetic protein FlhB
MATLDLGLRVGILLAIIAAADYGYQRWQYERDLRMSRDEVREEQKLLEGNPEVEARIRRMQITLSRSRMLRNVKKADVVVRNPTHYAVALKYDPAEAAAPVVLAKGADYLALRILELAREHRVHIVHDAPLARALYKTVEVGEAIPAKLYRAVARLLLHVYRLRGQNPPGAR